jgi:uroporphyrinogen III methyltransferase/synthase
VTGRVSLIGAGPGDAGLLTLRGRDLLGSADVVVVDRLVSAEVLAFAPEGAEVIYAGKSPGSHHLDQDGICAVLVERALAGRHVVRLKGGDPYVFGRGSEEVDACLAAGVPFTVVPGITSAFGVPALAGIPVTARGDSQAVTVVSGHLPPGSPRESVDWRSLATAGGTLVVLMGVANLGKIAAALVEHGRPSSTPIAVIERGATPAQRTTYSTLEAVDEVARAAGVRSPAIIVIGAVAVSRLPSRSQELSGRRILVPRSRPGPSSLAAALRESGADVVEETVLTPVAQVSALPTSGWLHLAAAGDAVALVNGLRAAGRDNRALAGLQIAAIPAVAEAAGLVADAEEPGIPVERPQVGWEPCPLAPSVLHALRSGDFDAIALPSSGTAAAMAAAVPDLPESVRVIAMGPQTAAAATSGGWSLAATSEAGGIEGLRDAVIGVLGSR